MNSHVFDHPSYGRANKARPAWLEATGEALLRRHLQALIMLLVLTCVLVVALNSTRWSSSQPTTSRIAVAQRPTVYRSGLTATVLSTKTESAGVHLLLHSSTVPVTEFVAATAFRIVSSDGRPLLATSILPGDTIVVRSGQLLVDQSQTTVSLTGIVASAPDPNGTVMSLQTSPSHSIVVDIARTTRISSKSSPSTGFSTIMDSDRVQVRGVLDSTLGELTETDSIVRLNP